MQISASLLAYAVCLAAASPLLSRSCSSECSNKKAQTSGFQNGTNSIQSGGHKRVYSVYVPKNYDSRKSYPLVIDYHGNGGKGWQQYENSQYNKFTQDYIVAYPDGFNGSWQGANYSTRGIDDLQFTTDLLNQMKTDYCVNSNRTYASGKSNGGGFVDLLACSDHGDAFAAFAMASPALYPDLNQTWCTKKRAILQSHGDKDVTIPYHPGKKDGSGGPLPDIDQWVSWWGHRTCGDRATADPSTGADLGGYNTTTYSCGKYAKVISHYQVFDLGHCWPSNDASNWDATNPKYNQTTRKCLDKALGFTPKVLDFFGKWNMTNVPKN